jgi:hypothetical protein
MQLIRWGRGSCSGYQVTSRGGSSASRSDTRRTRRRRARAGPGASRTEFDAWQPRGNGREGDGRMLRDGPGDVDVERANRGEALRSRIEATLAREEAGTPVGPRPPGSFVFSDGQASCGRAAFPGLRCGPCRPPPPATVGRVGGRHGTRNAVGAEISAPQTLVAWLREGADREALVELLVRRVWTDESLRREIAARMRSAPGESGLPDLRGALETILDVTAPAGSWSEACDLVADAAALVGGGARRAGTGGGPRLRGVTPLRRLDEGEEEVGGAFEEWPGFGEALVALEELHATAGGPAGRGGRSWLSLRLLAAHPWLVKGTRFSGCARVTRPSFRSRFASRNGARSAPGGTSTP